MSGFAGDMSGYREEGLKKGDCSSWDVEHRVFIDLVRKGAIYLVVYLLVLNNRKI